MQRTSLTFSLNIQKYGAYKFRFDRRKSDYFYADMQTVRGAACTTPGGLDYRPDRATAASST